jgi:aconitase B
VGLLLTHYARPHTEILTVPYLAEIASRATQGLAPKPIDDGTLIEDIIALIDDASSEYRADALKFFICPSSEHLAQIAA